MSTLPVGAASPDRLHLLDSAEDPEEARRIRELAPDRLFLMPGVGSQGGDIAAALRAALDARGGGVLPSASRSITYASSGADFETAAASAARALRDQANAARAAAVERR